MQAGLAALAGLAERTPALHRLRSCAGTRHHALLLFRNHHRRRQARALLSTTRLLRADEEGGPDWPGRKTAPAGSPSGWGSFAPKPPPRPQWPIHGTGGLPKKVVEEVEKVEEKKSAPVPPAEPPSKQGQQTPQKPPPQKTGNQKNYRQQWPLQQNNGKNERPKPLNLTEMGVRDGRMDQGRHAKQQQDWNQKGGQGLRYSRGNADRDRTRGSAGSGTSSRTGSVLRSFLNSPLPGLGGGVSGHDIRRGNVQVGKADTEAGLEGDSLIAALGQVEGGGGGAKATTLSGGFPTSTRAWAGSGERREEATRAAAGEGRVRGSAASQTAAPAAPFSTPYIPSPFPTMSSSSRSSPTSTAWKFGQSMEDMLKTARQTLLKSEAGQKKSPTTWAERPAVARGSAVQSSTKPAGVGELLKKPPTAPPQPKDQEVELKDPSVIRNMIDEVVEEKEKAKTKAPKPPAQTRSTEAFFDVGGLLSELSNETDAVKKSVLPSVKQRERKRQREEKMVNIGLGLEEKRNKPPADRGRAVEQEERRRREAEKRRRQEQARVAARNEPTPVILPDFITVTSLAHALDVPLKRFLGSMRDLGFDDPQHDHILNAEMAGLVAAEFGFAAAEQEDDGDLYPAPPADEAAQEARPPVVTIMGHVDHGKTTLLDYLRNTSVAAGEFGGITQHIGAFSVPLGGGGQTVTFLDTPGHAAFLKMRQRGAEVTDIVVLVVAADDGVMPQTKEAIKHAHEANVPVVVAITKSDLEAADPTKVKNGLLAAGVEVEDYGGDVPIVSVSAKTGAGVEELVATVTALAEVLDLKADPAGPVEASVVEVQKRPAGLAATIIVLRGTLRPGDTVVAGTAWARVRTMRNEAGERVASAPPGTPVEVDGWRATPAAGDTVLQAAGDKHAAAVVAVRENKADKDRMSASLAAINQARSAKARAEGDGDGDGAAADAELDELGRRTTSFLIKADVRGTAEAVEALVGAVGNDEVAARVLRAEIGPVTAKDVEFAATTGARVVAFNVPVPATVARAAELARVEVLASPVIYSLDELVRDRVARLLPPLVRETVVGAADVLAPFTVNVGKKEMPVAGCKVTSGRLVKEAKFRVVRKGTASEPAVTLFEGPVDSVKRGKKDVDEVDIDVECGIMFEKGWGKFKKGDEVICYTEQFETRRL